MRAGNDASTPTVPIATDDVERLPEARAARSLVHLLVAHREGVVTVPLTAGTSVVVGREPPADVVIHDKGLSRRHARFTLVAAEQIAVEDLDSMNGTKVGGKRVERAVVRPGEEVMLGPVAVSTHVFAGGDARPLGLEGHEAFRAAAEAELGRARFFGRPLAVLSVRALAESVHDGGFAPKPPGHRLVAWAPRVLERVRPIDKVALYGADLVEILVPEATRDEALALGRSIAAPQRGSPALGCGAAFFPGAGSVEELIEASLACVLRATAEQPVQGAAGEGHRVLAAGRGVGAGGIVMESPAMRDVARTAARLASAVIPVLIHGETGTGKEVLARLIHEAGPRRDKPLVAVNCGALPAELVESTLFGHEKGAFTGADKQQKGLFEAADGGTILLDEIAELPAPAQAALLRVLEDKRIRRVGAAREVEVDVRVLAATHRDLAAMVDAGGFRRDLLYRLDAMTVSLPPLRARRADIAPLSLRFLAKAATENGRDVRAIAPDAMALLERSAWPGNVRELSNAIARAVVIAEGDTITPRDLPEHVRAGGARPTGAAPARPTGSLESRLKRFERETILEALQEADHNQTEAARLLEVPLRTLQHKIAKLGIKRTLRHQPGEAEPED
jgi:DNA-binding NtrC family response regulator